MKVTSGFLFLVLSCFSENVQVGESETLQTSRGSTTGEANAEGCGNGIHSQSEYCFIFHKIETIIAPNAVLSAIFTNSPQFAVYTIGGDARLVGAEGASVVIQDELPSLNLAAYSQLIALNVHGSSALDIAHTSIWSAGFFENKEGTLQTFTPLGLPKEAFAAPGHTIPLDLKGDQKMDYLKGNGENIVIWSSNSDEWEKTETDFLVPGCKILVDFERGDFNSDGREDIAYIGVADTDTAPETCAEPATHGIAVLLQGEVGTLNKVPLVTTSQHKYTKISVGDFDGDGSDDLAALTVEEDFLSFRSVGNGQFETPHIIDKSLAFIVGNLDNDEKDEIVIFKKTRDTIIADDPFTDPKITLLQEVRGVPLAVGDLNLDGVGDIALLLDGVNTPILNVAISNP